MEETARPDDYGMQEPLAQQELAPGFDTDSQHGPDRNEGLPDGAGHSALGYWTDAEVENLKAAVGELQQSVPSHLIDWVKVAALVPGRTAKQCRQKWLNHLRDGISKDPWSLQEEYVLAVVHSKIGNKWQVLAKYLPRRPENTVKNHWAATTKAKGAARMRSLLWIYSDLVVHKGHQHSPEVFHHACVLYSQLKGVPHLSTFAVDEDHFLTGPGRGLAGLDSGIAAPMGISSRVPPETRMRLKAVNAAFRTAFEGRPPPPPQQDGYDDEQEAAAEEAEEGGGGGSTAHGAKLPPPYPHPHGLGGGAAAYAAMLPGMDAMHAEMASAWMSRHQMMAAAAAAGGGSGTHGHLLPMHPHPRPHVSLMQQQQQHRHALMQHYPPPQMMMQAMQPPAGFPLLQPPGGARRWPPPAMAGAPNPRVEQRPRAADVQKEVNRLNSYLAVAEGGGGGGSAAMKHDVDMAGPAGDDALQQQDQHPGSRERRPVQRLRHEHHDGLHAHHTAPPPLPPPSFFAGVGGGRRLARPLFPCAGSHAGAREPSAGGPPPDMNMLLALAEAADSLLSDEDRSKGEASAPPARSPFESDPKPQAPSSRKRRSSSGGYVTSSEGGDAQLGPFGGASRPQPEQAPQWPAAGGRYCAPPPPDAVPPEQLLRQQPTEDLSRLSLEVLATGVPAEAADGEGDDDVHAPLFERRPGASGPKLGLRNCGFHSSRPEVGEDLQHDSGRSSGAAADVWFQGGGATPHRLPADEDTTNVLQSCREHKKQHDVANAPGVAADAPLGRRATQSSSQTSEMLGAAACLPSSIAAAACRPDRSGSSCGAAESGDGPSASELRPVIIDEVQAAPLPWEAAAAHCGAASAAAPSGCPQALGALLQEAADRAAGSSSHEPSAAPAAPLAAAAAMGPSIEDSVVGTLAKLATDPSLAAADRLQLMSMFMRAVQSMHAQA